MAIVTAISDISKDKETLSVAGSVRSTYSLPPRPGFETVGRRHILKTNMFMFNRPPSTSAPKPPEKSKSGQKVTIASNAPVRVTTHTEGTPGGTTIVTPSGRSSSQDRIKAILKENGTGTSGSKEIKPSGSKEIKPSGSKEIKPTVSIVKPVLPPPSSEKKHHHHHNHHHHSTDKLSKPVIVPIIEPAKSKSGTVVAAPRGSALTPSGNLVTPGGTTVTPNKTVITPNGTTITQLDKKPHHNHHHHHKPDEKHHHHHHHHGEKSKTTDTTVIRDSNVKLVPSQRTENRPKVLSTKPAATGSSPAIIRHHHPRHHRHSSTHKTNPKPEAWADASPERIREIFQNSPRGLPIAWPFYCITLIFVGSLILKVEAEVCPVSEDPRETPPAEYDETKQQWYWKESGADYPVPKEQLGTSGRIRPGIARGKSLAVFTSGGDSNGMNAAIHAVVKFGLYAGFKVHLIHEGYIGMVNGSKVVRKNGVEKRESLIKEASEVDVSGIIHKGGTVIGSARCKEFMDRPGRVEAAANLVKHDITNLVVIGGDGSLTGANKFRIEWPSLLEDLVTIGKITHQQEQDNGHLNIVGIVGTIDNDFSGTDMTLGTDSALQRIEEAVYDILSTASSHRRTFIFEVMGRSCGYLALVAALTTEADFVMIPENPPAPGWEKELCSTLKQESKQSKRYNIIIITEKLKDSQGTPISVENVKKAIDDDNELQQEVRTHVVGHRQRGGKTSPFDRILGIRFGEEAIATLVEATPRSEAKVVSLIGNEVVTLSLMDCVRQTEAVAKAMKDKNFEEAQRLRGPAFQRKLKSFKMLNKFLPAPSFAQSNTGQMVHEVTSTPPDSGQA